jgi:tRNA-dihydrouridine synthase B
MAMNRPFFYLAPIKGLTDALFRDTFFRHFHGFASAVAPFINPQRKSLFDDKLIRDVLPGENRTVPIVPQLLHTDPDDFLTLAKRLAGLGYQHINWNLGCPVVMVAKKRRGSGLLPYPEEISDLLDQVMPQLPLSLSIKTRLGYQDKSELMALLPQLDRFNLQEIMIHPRLGRQLYKGSVDVDAFADCLSRTRHRVVYNGDIKTPADFFRLRERFPHIERWMIGRGALADPFLVEKITNTYSPGHDLERLYDFHADLLARYRQRLAGPGHLLGKLKQLWIYLIASFPANQQQLKKILKASSETAYQQAVAKLFRL